MLNWELLKSPYNWATIAIMALFGLVLLAVITPEVSTQGS